MRILIIGEVLRYRSFNGANKALPVLASALRNAGFEDVLQLDLERRDVDVDVVCDAATTADLICFAGCMTPQWPDLDATIALVCDTLLRVGRAHVPVIVGGYATKNVADIAEASPWITGFFDGEGEEAIVQIASLVAEGRFAQGMHEVQGLCFVDESGRFQQSTAPRVRNLDDIDQGFGFVHEPSIHDMDIFPGADGRPLKTAQLFTQRGCPWRCGFCNKSTESNAVVRVHADVLEAQLAELRAKGFEAVYLDVDTFTVQPAAAWQEAEVLGRSGLAWGTNTRIDRIDQELMMHCVRNGCVYMFFGVEHIDPGVAIAVEKFNGSLARQIRATREYPDKVRRVFQEMRAAKLPSSYFIILGLPKTHVDLERGVIEGHGSTTFEDDMAAIRFGLEHCDPDFLNFNVLRFMPGSAAADTPDHPAYSVVRPSGSRPIAAGWFLPRVARARGYGVTENHPVYRLCESVGMNQPTTTALDPERVYTTVRTTMDLINARIDAGERPTRLFIERALFDSEMVRQDPDGRYWLAPIAEWNAMDSTPSAVPDDRVQGALNRLRARTRPHRASPLRLAT